MNQGRGRSWKTVDIVIVGGVALAALGVLLYRFISPETAAEKQGFATVLALGLGGTAAAIGLYFTWKTTRNTRELEAERAREAALRACLEQLGRLTMDLPSTRNTQSDSTLIPPGSTHSKLARAHSSAVLGVLDAPRKRILVRFLYESGLLNGQSEHDGKPSVDLSGADLRKADLNRINLSDACLCGVRLRGANLYRTNLSGAILSDSDLRDYEGGDERDTDPVRTNLGSTNLSEAYLIRADLSGTDLSGADLGGADLSRADLSRADLGGVELSKAILRKTDLSKADLRGADLRGADLSGANLMRANLKDAEITREQLVSCFSLEGATMPNGSKHD